MKNLVIYFITILSILIIPIYPQHIPPCQGGAHGGQGACWGYAVGRAFNRGWNDSRCPISTLNFNNVSSTYFTWYSPFNIDAVQVGDIIAWGLQGTVHVAYVTGIYFRTNDGIILADRQNYGSPERTNLTLSILITERGGSPDGYFRKKNLWSITVENDVEGIHNVGKVSISGGVYNGQYDSPKIANQLNWESNMSITAVFDGTSYNNYVSDQPRRGSSPFLGWSLVHHVSATRMAPRHLIQASLGLGPVARATSRLTMVMVTRARQSS